MTTEKTIDVLLDEATDRKTLSLLLAKFVARKLIQADKPSDIESLSRAFGNLESTEALSTGQQQGWSLGMAFSQLRAGGEQAEKAKPRKPRVK